MNFRSNLINLIDLSIQIGCCFFEWPIFIFTSKDAKNNFFFNSSNERFQN